MKKVKTSPVATPVTTNTNNSIPLMPYQAPQHQQGQVISIGTGQNQQLINVLPLNQVNQDPLFVQVQPQQVKKQLLTIANSKDFAIHTG